MDWATHFNLKGKRALVCGASQGIGAATAQLLAQMGAQVCLLSRRAEPLEQIKKSLPGSGHQILTLDLSQTLEIEKNLKALLPFHIVINNAGGPKGGNLLEASIEEFQAGFQAHLFAAQKIAQLTVPAMKEAGYGRFINIISTSVKAPIPQLGVSNTVRGAMANWAKTLAAEVGPFGITVNNVLPGYTKTPRFEALRKSAAEKNKITEVQVENQWKASIPLQRFAEPSEVAAAVAFLASPAASYISGINLPVDGGRTPSL
jgi:3-oxoacyl-[acyl-carrier protein] reductase